MPRTLRTLFAAMLLAAAGAPLAACGSVTIQPADPEWTVTGEPGAAQATWRSGDVDVIVPLQYEADATHVTADVQNAGREPAWVTVAIPGASPVATGSTVPIGTVSGGPPTYESAWSETVFPGRPVEVPAGAPGRPGALRFALLPDKRWGLDDAPPVGSGIALDLTVSTSAGDAPCGFRFVVTATSDESWRGLTRAGQWTVVLLLSAVTTAAILWVN